MSLLPIEQKMWQEKATAKTKNGKSATDIVAKYYSREKRILTEVNREKLPSFAEALKKPGYMNIQPFYQRRSRWDKQKQSRLIESFLVNIPVPPIILYEQDYNSYEVMDGQQRITAIKDFYENQLKLTGLELWSELNGFTYQELNPIIRAGIDRPSISTIVIITESTTDPEEAMFLKQQTFERLNTGGVDLSKQEVRHCLYHGKFVYGTTNQNKNYQLLPEAFLLHDQNLRKDILEKLFADAGIGNTWQWVVKHRKVKNFIEEIRGNQNTAEGELNQLISYRNEAAHGVVDQILGTQELLDLGDFIKALCQALAELVTYQIIQKQTYTGKAKEIGEITEWFKKPKAAVAIINDSKLSLGTNVFLVSETSSYCRLATIESIKFHDNSQESIEITSKTEVGLKFDIDAKKGLKIYIIV